MSWGLRARLFGVSLVLILLAAATAWLAAPWAVEELVAGARGEELLTAGARIAAQAERSTGGWSLLARTGADDSRTRVLLLDGAGVTLADSHPGAERPLALPSQESGGWTLIRGESPRPSLLAETPILRGSTRGGSVRLVEPLTPLTGATAAARLGILLLALIALLGSFALSSLAGRWTSRLLSALTLAARKLSAGDPAARGGAPRPAEFGELGRAVDQLAGSLFAALQKLKSERDQLVCVLATLQEGALVLDQQGRVELINPALQEMLLLPPDPRGRLPLEVLRSSDLQQLLVRAREAPASSEFELSGLKPRRVQARAAALAGPQGGMLVLFADVTNVRRLEALRREFVANVSHELRTPVASIRSAAETLESALDDPQAAARFVGIIGRNAERMHRLVDDLLDLARIEAKELRLRPEPLVVRVAVDQALALFREQAERRRIPLETEIEGGALAVRADRKALEQVLANLIDNAVKYCPDDGRIVVRAQRDGARVRIAVEDSGPGIEPRHLPRLFERFYRIDAGRSRALGGTGLGLSIVKHLVESMGGTVGVESEVGKGSKFLFFLPRSGP